MSMITLLALEARVIGFRGKSFEAHFTTVRPDPRPRGATKWGFLRN
jgi:hypothetical protein